MRPEMTVKKLVHGMGYRYRLAPQGSPRQARSCVFKPPKGDFRSWLLLASASGSFLQDRSDTKVTAGLLASKAGEEQSAGCGKHFHVEKRRVGCSYPLGVRVEGHVHLTAAYHDLFRWL